MFSIMQLVNQSYMIGLCTLNLVNTTKKNCMTYVNESRKIKYINRKLHYIMLINSPSS